MTTFASNVAASAESFRAEELRAWRDAHELVPKQTENAVALVCSCGHWGPVVVAAKVRSAAWRARMELEDAEWRHFEHKTDLELR